MDANALNSQFPPGMLPGQQGYLQQMQSHVSFLVPSQMQLPSAYCQGPQGQMWLRQDGFAPPMPPRSLSQRGAPQWIHPQVFAPQHQQVLQPGLVEEPRQPVPQSSAREFLPHQSGQGYDPQLPVQGYLPHHSLQDLVAAVAGQLGYTSNVDHVQEIAQCADNDNVIIGALRQGKAKGLNDLVAIEKLGDANGHANGLWKDYALARLQKIYPQVHSTSSTSRGVTRSKVNSRQTGSRQRSSLCGLKHPSQSRPTTNSRNCAGTDDHANPISFVDRRLGHDYQAYHPSFRTPQREGPSSPTNVQLRSRRGGPIPEYHAGTLIPPFDPSSPPKPPQPGAGDDHDSNRFTDADKIFFIHFLKWHLRQGRMTIPDREDLYILLARQTLHHNAEAWKRHWDDAPELPDKIYIEARKRADDEALARSASLSPSSSGDESDEGIDAADGNESYKESTSTSPVLNRGDLVGRRRRRPRKYVKVTNEDLREMAKYKYERRDVWDKYPNGKARWEEFWQRPQNQKRSLIAWSTVSRDYNEEIDRYYNEYTANASLCSYEKSEVGAESELEYLDVTTPPQRDLRVGSASASTSSRTDGHTAGEVLTPSGAPQKRERSASMSETTYSAGTEEASFPVAKRVKEEEDEKTELIEVDSD